MAGPLLVSVLFSGWVLFGSRLRWREKLGLAAAALICPVIAAVISVPESALRTTLWTNGVPLAVFTVTAGLSLASVHPRRSWVAAALLAIGWGSFALVRNEGFDGDYYPEFTWRWTPVHESTLPQLGSPSADGNVPESLDLQSSDVTETLTWPGFRGLDGSGVVADSLPSTDWKANPPREVWRIPVGPAWSSFSHHNGRLFTQEQRGDMEYITCYSAEDGQLIWSHSDSTRFTEVVSGAGPRSTPSVRDGHVFALGGRGLLTCVRENDGVLVWQRNLEAELSAPVPMWGFSGSPLIHDGMLIVYAGGSDGHGLISLDSATGSPKWKFSSSGMNYSTARVFTLSEQSLIVFCDGNGIHALEPQTGAEVWTFKPDEWQGPAMVDPQLLGPDRLLISLGDGIGMCCLEVKLSDEKWLVNELWRSTRLRPSFNDSVVDGDSVYGFNQSIFSCIDANTGERRWHGGRYGFGQAVLLKDSSTIVVAAENGDAVFLKATPEKLEEQLRLPVLNDKTWNHPIVVGNRLFMRNGKVAVCLELAK